MKAKAHELKDSYCKSMALSLTAFSNTGGASDTAHNVGVHKQLSSLDSVLKWSCKVPMYHRTWVCQCKIHTHTHRTCASWSTLRNATLHQSRRRAKGRNLLSTLDTSSPTSNKQTKISQLEQQNTTSHQYKIPSRAKFHILSSTRGKHSSMTSPQP